MRGFFLSLASDGGRVSLPANLDTMLTLDYLKSILFIEETETVNGVTTTTITPEVEGVTSVDQVLESAAGYDGIIELIQTKGLPVAVVLEHNEMGNLSIRPGGFMMASQSIWIMEMVAADEARRAIQMNCWRRMKRIISVLAKHFDDDDKPLVDKWEPEDIPYGIRNAGSNYTGYEMLLHFNENIDLSYHPMNDGN